ncbi:hypothetical protein [uncultured Clostridium sp.]|uniref:hypothetical protein n=1 Tax=uncultured Clostridium sp. TaxID=59620 RepID=UPI0025E5C094|nr:hypothetical protein [uncultured Clostridium sp.]
MPKKKYIFYAVLILLILLLFFLSFLSIKLFTQNLKTAKSMEKALKVDLTSPFSVNKIVYFSSANAKSEINANSSFTISDLYQYTDIAIFINNNSDGNYNAKNTLKKVSLSNISFNLKPSIGTPDLYFKNINDFASNSLDESKKIENNLDFEISSEDEIDYSKPILYNNCANPITLCYVNSGLKSNYTLTDNISHISYDGTLLKRCGITLNSIACKLSFVINITNNLDEVYSCPFILNIPLSTESNTVYDGSLVVNNSVNYNFIRP